MPVTIGLDIGTTTVSCVAVDTDCGEELAFSTLANNANTTSAGDRARGRSEWNAEGIARIANAAVNQCAGELGQRLSEVAGIGITGQQHGVVLLDAENRAVSPLINWQDRRGEEIMPGEGLSYVQKAADLAGPEAPRTSGCVLSAGFMGVTLYWLSRTGALPEGATAAFAADFVGAALTGRAPVTDPTNGASSGLFDLQTRTWDEGLIARLGLPRSLFPQVREAGDALGGLSAEAAVATGLPVGLPVFVALGDNQASFLGSVADLEETVLINVGTGAQVGCFVDSVCHAPPLETRPFAREGYLLVHAGLSGGQAYAILHNLLRQIATQLLGSAIPADLYERMNSLAAQAPAGAGGLVCDPYFAGARWEPERRASITGMSDINLTPDNVIRSVLEGMARVFLDGYGKIQTAAGGPRSRLVGAGNGLRQNAVLSQIVAQTFGLPLRVPVHREEAACGAALIAGVGAGVFASVAEAARIVQYQED